MYRKLICLRFALNDLVIKKSDKINTFVRQQNYSLNDLIKFKNFTLSAPNTDTDNEHEVCVYYVRMVST